MHTPTNFDQTNRAGPLAGIPSRNDIVAEFDNGMTAILQQCLSAKQHVHFMPTEVSDDTKYINGISTYILRITSSLINGQKAVVNITGIRPFFDAEVPENYSPSSFKTTLARILSVTLKTHQSLDLRIFVLTHLGGIIQKREPIFALLLGTTLIGIMH
jgi:hypothetical protein